MARSFGYPRDMDADPRFWNQIAAKYAAKPVEDPDAFERKIAVTRQLIEPGMTLLEVGCGTGSLAMRLADRGARYHGLDIAEAMVRYARDKVAEAGMDNLEFSVGRFDDTFDQFDPGSVDGVLAFSLLHLIQDRRAALARMFALLKPGGFLVSSTLCLKETWVPYPLLITVMQWFGKAPYVGSFSKAALKEDMAAVGFDDIEERDVGAKEKTVAFLVARKPS